MATGQTARSYEERIKELKRYLEQARDLRSKAIGALDQHRRREQEILQQIRELGVEPDKLDEEIERLQREVEIRLRKVQEMIPWELIGRSGSARTPGS